MRILVNDIAASEGGALSILKDFYHYVKKNDQKNEWLFLTSNSYIEESERIKIQVLDKQKKWIERILFDLFKWKDVVNNFNPDVILSLQNTNFCFCKYPQVLYIHQPLPFQNIKKFSLFKKQERIFWVYQYLIGWMIKKSAKRSEKIIVQTEWMKRQVEKIAGEGAVLKMSPNIPELELDNEEKWNQYKFIYPTSTVIYKNNEYLYKVSETLAKKGYNFTVEVTLEEEKKVKGIEFIGKIPRKRLLKKYEECTLVFPSYIETYGLPLAEAKLAGTLILAADTEFSHEILSDYKNAYFFNPFDEKELFLLMERVITGDIKKEKISIEPITKNTWGDLIKILENIG